MAVITTLIGERRLKASLTWAPTCACPKTYWSASIDPIHKGVSLFLSYTNMNKMNSLHHVKEHPKISNFLQFESHSSKSFKVRAISDLRDLYGNNIQGLTSLDSNFCNLYDWFLGRKYWYHSKDPVQISVYVQFQRCTWNSWWVIGTLQKV